jgi:hypothetical protein
MQVLKIAVGVLAAAMALCTEPPALRAADSGPVTAAAVPAGSPPNIQIEPPAILIRGLLKPAADIISKGLTHISGPQQDRRPELSLVSAQYDAAFPEQISYTFYTMVFDARGNKPGTTFYWIKLKSSGVPLNPLQPFLPIKYHEGLTYNKDIRPITDNFKDLDEVVRLLQNRFTADLGLNLRQELCARGPVRFKLMPRFTLLHRASGLSYATELSLYADYEHAAGAPACANKACGIGSRISLEIDPLTGNYRAQDYWDGLAYIQYAAGLKPVQRGKDKKAEAAAQLKRAFLMFDTLFAPGGDPAYGYSHELLQDNLDVNKAHYGNSPQSDKAESRRIAGKIAGEQADLERLARAMAKERLKSVQTALKLDPQLAMAHAALGLLLTKDCTQKIPSVGGNCEKGVRSLLKARELAPELAFPVYVLANRLGLAEFPKALKAGLKTTPAELCGKFKGSAPAWDWAFSQSCGGRESPAQPAPVIRPGEILSRYLDLELSAQPR